MDSLGMQEKDNLTGGLRGTQGWVSLASSLCLQRHLSFSMSVVVIYLCYIAPGAGDCCWPHHISSLSGQKSANNSIICG